MLPLPCPKEDVSVELEGYLYGELEVVREDFAGLLRGLGFKVVEDVDIPKFLRSYDPGVVREYCWKKDVSMVTLYAHDVPFYYSVDADANWIRQRLRHLRQFKVVLEGKQDE